VTSQVISSRVKSSQVIASIAKASQVISSHHDQFQHKSTQVISSHLKSYHALSNHLEAYQVIPNNLTSSQANSSQAISSHVESYNFISRYLKPPQVNLKLLQVISRHLRPPQLKSPQAISIQEVILRHATSSRVSSSHRSECKAFLQNCWFWSYASVISALGLLGAQKGCCSAGGES